MIQASNLKAEAQTQLKQAESKEIPYVNNGMALSGMDCQGLVEYLQIQCGESSKNVNLAGSNAHWRKSLKWKGSVEETIKLFGKIPEGAWLFIWKDGYNSKYNDNNGDASHVGQYISGSVVVHASSSRKKVAESYIGTKSISGGWNRVGLNKYTIFPADVESKISVNANNQNKDGETKMNYNATVTSDGVLNMRAAKSTSSTRLDQITPGSSVNVLEDDGTWCKISYGGKTGYVLKQYLQENEGSSVAPAGANVTISIDKAIATSLYNALRNGLGV